MPENNEMNNVAIETAAETVTEAVRNAPATTDTTFSTQHPFLTAIGITAAIPAAAVFGVWAMGKLCDGADKLGDKWRNWRADVKAKKAAKKATETIVVEQEKNA